MLYKVLLFIGVLFNVLAQFFLKSCMNQVMDIGNNKNITGKIAIMITNKYFFMGILFYGVGFLLYSFVLMKIELSKAYPVASVVTIILISTVSILFLKEGLGYGKIVGTIFCIVGIAFLLK